MNLTLRQQIFLSYIVMILFSLIVGVYAIWSLTELTTITNDLIYNNLATSEKLIKLHDSVLAQDLYEKRYLGLQQPDAAEQFWSRSREFKSLVADISSLNPSLSPVLERVTTHHDTYNRLFTEEMAHIAAKQMSAAVALSSGTIKSNFDKILLLIKDADLNIKGQQTRHISRSNSLGERALMITITLSVVAFVIGILFAYLITNHLTTAIGHLKAATRSIRSGNFDNLPEIRGADELADLAISFKEMSARLKELEEMNLDANPLTKLPGNLAIEKELLTRLNETRRFSFCLIDLDNFKGFNDRYGYARGSDVIKWLGDILLITKKILGMPRIFLDISGVMIL